MNHELNPYKISAVAEQKLTHELLQERPFKMLGRFACYEIAGDNKYADIGRNVEGEVFGRIFNDTPRDMKEGYEPYEDQSTFFLSIDRKYERAAGVLRVIEHGENGFKTLNDLSHLVSEDDMLEYHNVDRLQDCYDIGTVAVRRAYRGNLTSAAQLYRAAQLSAEEKGIKHYIAALDHRAYDRLVSYAGAPFTPLAGLGRVPYMGSTDTQPAFMSIADINKSVTRNLFTPKGIIGARIGLPQVLGTLDHTIYRDA